MKGNIALSNFTSFGTGGKAPVIFLEKKEELLNIASPVFIGRGTNLLVSDGGISQTVVINRTRGIKREGDSVIVSSGETLPFLAKHCQSEGLSGLEALCGIPGSVGGATVMNAGAFGVEIKDLIESVEYFSEGKFFILPKAQCGFSYRASKIDGFITSVRLKLKKASPDEILKLMMRYKEKRLESQPLGKSAGSVFKRVGTTSAGFYIERASLKGRRVGGAKISEKHANFIINDGYATSEDIYKLILIVEREVYEKFGIKLEREIKLIGDF